MPSLGIAPRTEGAPTPLQCRHRAWRRFQVSFRRMVLCIVWRLGYQAIQLSPYHAGHRVLLLMRHEALRRIPSSAGRNSKGGFWVKWLTPIRKVTGTRACQEGGGQVQVSEMMRRGTRVIWRKLDCLISQSPDDAKK